VLRKFDVACRVQIVVRGFDLKSLSLEEVRKKEKCLVEAREERVW
jgi:hypothetical protein